MRGRAAGEQVCSCAGARSSWGEPGAARTPQADAVARWWAVARTAAAADARRSCRPQMQLIWHVIIAGEGGGAGWGQTHLSSSTRTDTPVLCMAAACSGEPRSFVTAFTSAPFCSSTCSEDWQAAGLPTVRWSKPRLWRDMMHWWVLHRVAASSPAQVQQPCLHLRQAAASLPVVLRVQVRADAPVCTPLGRAARLHAGVCRGRLAGRERLDCRPSLATAPAAAPGLQQPRPERTAACWRREAGAQGCSLWPRGP